MYDDQTTVPIYPGQDTKSHARQTQKNISRSLSDYLGNIDDHQVAPGVDHPIVQAGDISLEQPGSELDFDDIIKTVKGSEQTADSNKFLQKFLLRLKSKHPEGMIKQK